MADPGTIFTVIELVYRGLKEGKELAENLKDAPDDLAKVIANTERLAVQLRRLQAKERGMSQKQRHYLEAQVNRKESRELASRLVALITKVKPLDRSIADSGQKLMLTMAERVKWLWNKNEVEDLVQGLISEATRIQDLVMSEVIFGIDERLELLTLRAVEENTPRFDADGVYSPFKDEAIAWYGQVRCKPGQDFSMPYFRDRMALAHAAYLGDWISVIKLLDHARHVYKQRWINCASIRTCLNLAVRPPVFSTTKRCSDGADDSSSVSGFRPLHQAAWYGKKSVAEFLIRNGAWCLARTIQDTKNSKKDCTPLDIARDYEWDHLYDQLSPVIKRPISHKVLETLQESLDNLIWRTFGSYSTAHLDCFILPQLEVLTQFDRARLWFPIQPELLDTRDGPSVQIFLGRIDLTVVMRWGREKRKNYRISMAGTEEIEQAVILH